MSENEPGKKKLVSRWDWIWLVVVGVILLSILLAKFDIHFAYHSEKTEIVDNKKQKQRIKTSKRERKIEMGGNYDLKQIAESLSVGDFEDLSYFGLERAEISFYRRIHKAYKDNERINSPKAWFAVLKQIKSTYNVLTDIFEENKRSAQRPNSAVYSDIERAFQIPEERSKQFASSEGGDLLDWTLFINQQR